jgi:hypothetical protein
MKIHVDIFALLLFSTVLSSALFGQTGIPKPLFADPVNPSRMNIQPGEV